MLPSIEWRKNKWQRKRKLQKQHLKKRKSEEVISMHEDELEDSDYSDDWDDSED